MISPMTLVELGFASRRLSMCSNARETVSSFNGKPKATAFRHLHELCDADAFGLPLNDVCPLFKPAAA